MRKTKPQPPPVSAVWIVDAAAAPAVAERVFDPARLPPLVLVSTSRAHGDRPLIDAAELHQQIGEMAQIAVMADDAASWVLSKRLGRLAAWGGAVRVYRPDAQPTDRFERHPLVRVDPRRPRLALAEVAAHVRAAAGLPAARLSVLRAPAAPPEEVRAGQRDAELKRLAAALAERDRLLKEKDATIAELRQQVRKLTKKLRAGSEANEPKPTIVYADPERQFRWEVTQHWLTTVTEAERDARPLADYRLGRDWLASLEAIELVGRRKILDVVVEVLTGRVIESTGRRLRRMRSSDAGGSSPRIREDGAVAWRCDIKHGTASAPRLMWWKLPDGVIELGRVAAHDDVDLR